MPATRAKLFLVFVVGLAVACRDAATAPDVAPSFLYSDEFYGHSSSCDPPGSTQCNPKMLTTRQRVAVQNVVYAMSGCKEMQAYAQQLLDDGSIWYYTNDDGHWGDSHWPNVNQAHIWSGTFKSDMLPETIAHEVAHIFYQTTSELVATSAQLNCGFTDR